jgi:hypothetical protein
MSERVLCKGREGEREGGREGGIEISIAER